MKIVSLNVYKSNDTRADSQGGMSAEVFLRLCLSPSETNKERGVERENEVKEREADGHVQRGKQERMKMSDLMLLSARQNFQRTASLTDGGGGGGLEQWRADSRENEQLLC